LLNIRAKLVIKKQLVIVKLEPLLKSPQLPKFKTP